MSLFDQVGIACMTAVAVAVVMLPVKVAALQRDVKWIKEAVDELKSKKRR